MVEIDYKKIYGDWGYSKAFDIDLARSAVVVIDMQPAFTDPDYDFMQAYTAMLPMSTDYFARRVRDVVLPNIARLIQAARTAGVPVTYVVTYSETDDLSDMTPVVRDGLRRIEKHCGRRIYRKWSPGMDIYDEIKPEDHELVVAKKTGSAFVSSMLPWCLRNMGVETLFLTGCNTNGCVFESAVVAKEMGWRNVLVSDATGCFAPEQQELIEEHIFPVHYGIVRSTGDVVGIMSPAGA